MSAPQSTAVAALAARCAALAEPRAPAWHGRAALHLLDWLGNAAAGAAGLGSAAGPAFARWLAMQPPGPVPTLSGRGADAAAAALYHGALGSTLEMDDVHRSSILHPGPVVVPAVLAALPPGASGASGARLLSALAAGYEAAIRVGRALGPAHYRWWHSTATAGSFGAAAGAAAAMGLGEAGIAQALALAGTRAGGLWQVRHEPSLGKAWHMAGAARDGVTAAQLAAAGVTGPLGVLDGASGWLAATAAGASADAVTEPRAEPWLLDVSFKPWPACRHAHPAMDALREAAGTQALAPQAVAAITVHGYDDALRFCDRPQPRSEAEARFSIQHALAAWVAWGEPALAHYGPDAIADPVVTALRECVQVHADPALQARYPAAYGARVQIAWRDGHTSEALLHDTYGDPARPMPPHAVERKARSLMQAAGWPAARIDAACAACHALPQANDLAALHAVIQPETPA